MPIAIWRAEENISLMTTCMNIERDLGIVLNIVPLSVQVYRDKTITIEAAIVYSSKATTKES